MPNKITKSEIRQSLSDAIQKTVSKYGVAELSRKKSKAIESFSKKLAVDIKDEIKKRLAKEVKVKRLSAKKSKKDAPVPVVD